MSNPVRNLAQMAGAEHRFYPNQDAIGNALRNAAPPGVAQVQSPLQQRMEELQVAIEGLHRQLETLEKNIQFVLLPQAPPPPQADNKVPAEMCCDLITSLDGRIDDVNQVHFRLVRLNSRINL